MSNSSGITTLIKRLMAIVNFVKKRMFCSGETLGLLRCIKGGHTGIIYRPKILYVSQRRMTIDLLPIKPQMAAILDVFFNETLTVSNCFINKFSKKIKII